MRAITVVPGQPGSARLEEVPEPPPSGGAILVQALALGVCGTDHEIVEGGYGEPPPGRLVAQVGEHGLGQPLDGRDDEVPPGHEGRRVLGRLADDEGLVGRPEQVALAHEILWRPEDVQQDAAAVQEPRALLAVGGRGGDDLDAGPAQLGRDAFEDGLVVPAGGLGEEQRVELLRAGDAGG